MKNILVLCTGNSCRSQMAEGYLKYFAGDKIKVYSAGIEIHGLNPLAVQVMKEDGIDISGQSSDHIDRYKKISFDLIITVCDHAQENCPWFFSGAKRFHQNFPDPAKVRGTADEILHAFRNVRDLIKKYAENFIEEQL